MKLLMYILLFVFTLSAGEITAVTIPSWPPFMYEENDTITGAATDIVRMILDSAEVPYSITKSPWARAFLNTQEKQNFLLFIVYRTPEREKMFRWIGPIIPSYDMSFYKLKSADQISLEKLDDAKKFRVGVVRNVANHRFLEEKGFIERKNLFPVSTPDQNCLKLFHNRIDLLISNEYTLPLLLHKHGYSMEQVERVYDVIESKPGYIAINPQTDDSLVRKIEEVYDRISTSTLFDSIIQKYQVITDSLK